MSVHPLRQVPVAQIGPIYAASLGRNSGVKLEKGRFLMQKQVTHLTKKRTKYSLNMTVWLIIKFSSTIK